MKIYVDIKQKLYKSLWEHLLPESSSQESAAFIFAEPQSINGQSVFITKDIYLAQYYDFSSQHYDYLELTDQARVRIIKQAHQLQASIIELHSHPFAGSLAASFSYADLKGLSEIVPHIWWRLNKKPYGAIVVAPNGFDALIWWDNPKTPRKLDGLKVGDEILLPTNITLGGYNG